MWEDLAWMTVDGSGRSWKRKEPIEAVLETVGPIGAEILQRRPDFARAAASARTDVSHPRGTKTTSQDFSWIAEALTWVVRTHLLINVGVDPDHLHKQITERGNYPQVLDGINPAGRL